MKYLSGKINRAAVLTFIFVIFILQTTAFAEPFGIEFKLYEGDCGESVVSSTKGVGSLYASADGTNMEKIRWDSDTSILAPRMQGKNLATGWNVGGYWLIKFSSKNIYSLKFSADMFSSGKGPKNFVMYYSTDKDNFRIVNASSVSLSKNNATVYNELPLPNEVCDKENVYLKLMIETDEAVNGSSIVGVKDGSTYINNIVITDARSGGLGVSNESVRHYYKPSNNVETKRFGENTGKYIFEIRRDEE